MDADCNRIRSLQQLGRKFLLFPAIGNKNTEQHIGVDRDFHHCR